MASRYNPAAEILVAVGAVDVGEKIRAHFRRGDSAVYSACMADLLKTDPGVWAITSESTGEILWEG